MNDNIRAQFPALSRRVNDKPCIYLDGPAGTQVPISVIDGISDYYKTSNANTHGHFLTSQETDELMSNTRDLVAEFLGVEGPHNISLGQNMTSLNYSLARAIGRYLQQGDEIIITALDHEANRGPWLSLEKSGLKIQEVKMTEQGTLDYDDFINKLNDRTRLVCVGWASNMTGAVNDLNLIRNKTAEIGAWLLVDAVHYAPHFNINVGELGCDFLLCSAYKFYGPHVGILYAKTGLLEELPTDRLRTVDQCAPYIIETGTLNHAAIAGVKAAIEFILKMGEGSTIRDQLTSAFERIKSHERRLALLLYNGISKIENARVIGPDFQSGPRAPTLSFFHENVSAQEICKQLSDNNIFAWDGHFYAIRATEFLGLKEKGGVTRMGISMYTNEDDIVITLDTLEKILG